MLDAIDFIVKDSLLNDSDCNAIKRSMNSYIEGGDLIAFRSTLDYYYRLSLINAGMYYRLIELARTERKEMIYMLVDIKISQFAKDKERENYLGVTRKELEQEPYELKSLEALHFFGESLIEIISSYEEDAPGIVHKFNAINIEDDKKLYKNPELFEILTKVNDFMLKCERQN